MRLLFQDFTRPYVKSLSIEKKAICVLGPEIRALTAVLGPLIIAHFSAFVKRKNKKFRRVANPAEIMYTLYFWFSVDRRTLPRGSCTHTIQYCTLKAIRGVDPSVRLICWTFTCSLKQYDKKLDKPQFRFPPHSANTVETRLILMCGFG